MAKSPAAAAQAPAKPTTEAQKPDAPPASDTPLLDMALMKPIAAAEEVVRQWKEIDENPAIGHFYRAMAQANVLERLGQLLDQKVMQKIMRLQNEPTGFLTDEKNGYHVDVIRACVIDALLAGFYPSGNEFNIIRGKMMPVKNGYKRRLKSMPGFADLDGPRCDLPVVEKGQTTVKVFATWTWNERRYELTSADGKSVGRVFPVKVNAGADALNLWGKAERLGLKAIYERITGSAFAEADDDVDQNPAPGNLVKDLEKNLEEKPANGGEMAAALKPFADALAATVRGAKMDGVFSDDEWPTVLQRFGIASKSSFTAEQMKTFLGELEQRRAKAKETLNRAPQTAAPVTSAEPAKEAQPEQPKSEPAPTGKAADLFPQDQSGPYRTGA